MAESTLKKVKVKRYAVLVKRYAVLVVWLDGVEEYVCQGLGDDTAKFNSYSRAKAQADFLRMGTEDQCQSINVVEYPD